MPELPDLVHIEAELRAAVVGKRIVAARTGDPLVLRIMVTDAFPGVLVGKTIADVTRRGHFMRFTLDGDLFLLVNAMLAGRFVLAPSSETKTPKSLALALSLQGGGELRYVDDARMGKVYVAGKDKLRDIPQYGRLGVEILSDAFTPAHFRTLIAKRRDQVRRFLMDKEAIASIGNAYADEILFAARIHPKTFCGKLSDAEIATLHQSVIGVMKDAIEEVRRRNEPMQVKVRDFLKVRGKSGQPCPRCGTTIRTVRVGEGDACFCPTCQPTGRKLFVDWSKLPRANGKSDKRSDKKSDKKTPGKKATDR